MRRTIRSLSWAERESMIREYLRGDCSKIEIWRKYTGQDEEHGHLLRWMRTLGYVSKKEELFKGKKEIPYLPMSMQDDSTGSLDQQELEKRVKQLERQLEDAQLKVEGLELMIEMAERELKVPIRKKSGTR